jgi:hypothetical protein
MWLAVCAVNTHVQGLTVTLAGLTTLLCSAKNTAWKMSFLFCDWTKPWSVLELWLRSYGSRLRTGRQPSVKTVKAVTLSCTAVTTSNVRVTQHVTILQVFHFMLRRANSWSTTVCVCLYVHFNVAKGALRKITHSCKTHVQRCTRAQQRDCLIQSADLTRNLLPAGSEMKPRACLI